MTVFADALGCEVCSRFVVIQPGDFFSFFFHTSVCTLPYVLYFFIFFMFPVKLLLSLMSLNVRGIQNKVKRKAMLLFCKNSGSRCIFFFFTRNALCHNGYSFLV